MRVRNCGSPLARLGATMRIFIFRHAVAMAALSMTGWAAHGASAQSVCAAGPTGTPTPVPSVNINYALVNVGVPGGALNLKPLQALSSNSPGACIDNVTGDIYVYDDWTSEVQVTVTFDSSLALAWPSDPAAAVKVGNKNDGNKPPDNAQWPWARGASVQANSLIFTIRKDQKGDYRGFRLRYFNLAAPGVLHDADPIIQNH